LASLLLGTISRCFAATPGRQLLTGTEQHTSKCVCCPQSGLALAIATSTLIRTSWALALDVHVTVFLAAWLTLLYSKPRHEYAYTPLAIPDAGNDACCAAMSSN
jgi:hypothetical protein